MAEVLLFHHAQGLTEGGVAFTRPAAGHTYATLEEGIGCARETGFGTVVQRGLPAADALLTEPVLEFLTRV